MLKVEDVDVIVNRIGVGQKKRHTETADFKLLILTWVVFCQRTASLFISESAVTCAVGLHDLVRGLKKDY